MPTYEYECSSCGKTFERFQSISEKPLRRCPLCRKGKVRRLIGAGAGILFRGSGFYETDYRSAEYKAKAKAEQTGGGAKAETSTESSSSDSKSSSGKDGAKTKA
jgi:putative FmdB family regulatory protein